MCNPRLLAHLIVPLALGSALVVFLSPNLIKMLRNASIDFISRKKNLWAWATSMSYVSFWRGYWRKQKRFLLSLLSWFFAILSWIIAIRGNKWSLISNANQTKVNHALFLQWHRRLVVQKITRKISWQNLKKIFECLHWKFKWDIFCSFSIMILSRIRTTPSI